MSGAAPVQRAGVVLGVRVPGDSGATDGVRVVFGVCRCGVTGGGGGTWVVDGKRPGGTRFGGRLGVLPSPKGNEGNGNGESVRVVVDCDVVCGSLSLIHI